MNRIKKKQIRSLIARVPFLKQIYKAFKKNNIKDAMDNNSTFVSFGSGVVFESSLECANKVLLQWPEYIAKPYVGLMRDENNQDAYWPKYERFLKNNHIPYDFYNIHKSDFIEESKKFDMIVWRTASNPAEQEEASQKIWVLEKLLGKVCIPSTEELWFYENKLNQYYICKIMNLPIVNTFVTNEKHEAMDYIKKCKFPAVAKITCGAGSQGVRLVKNYKQAKGICNKVFEDGLPTYWRYIKQKNYIYFQDFVPNAKFDLRIIIAGNSFFGYYRQIPKDDFRASGAGKEDFATPIPEEALLLAKKVKDNFPKTKMLAVDMLKDERNGLLYIIECSIFLHVDFPSELTVNGRQGRYIYENGQFVFEEGKYWCQELSLLEAMKEWINQNNCCNEKVDEYVIQPNR